MDVVKEFELKGWLTITTDDVEYESGDYDKDYNYLGRGDIECTESSPLLGLNTEKGMIILAEKLKCLLQEAYKTVKNRVCMSAQITYHVSDEQMTWEEFSENRLMQVFGHPEAKYGHHCSDLTGYLWTDEIFVVNKHDLIRELWSFFGDRYCYNEKEKPKKWFHIKIIFYK